MAALNFSVCRRWRRVVNCCLSSKRSFVFRNSFRSIDKPPLSLKTFEMLMAPCLNLRELDLTSLGCRVSENFIQVVGNVCRKLERLIMPRSGIDNKALKLLVENCPFIKTLNISGPHSTVDIEALNCLVQLKQLVDLDVSYIQAVDDSFLSELSRSGRLKRLICRGCFNISSSSIIDLFNFCLNLREVDVSACDGVGNGILNPLKVHLEQRNVDYPIKVVIGGSNVIIEDDFVCLTNPLLNLVKDDWSNKNFVRDARGDMYDDEDDFDFEEDNFFGDSDDFSDGSIDMYLSSDSFSPN
ncbi:hypothetical protein CHUAL_006014 [Chamberlinius hualienensis]